MSCFSIAIICQSEMLSMDLYILKTGRILEDIDNLFFHIREKSLFSQADVIFSKELSVVCFLKN